jgi:5-methylcytosine-specific restriction enzyme A
MARKEFPARIKVAAYERAGGACEGCSAPLRGKPAEYDHIVPAAFGGAPALDNCKVLCVPCHRGKTAERDIPEIAKSNRLRARNAGVKKRRHVLPGSRASKWKRKLDGTVERRE